METKSKNSYIIHKEFINALKSNALHNLCGVRVIWTPSGYGKSTSIAHTLNDLKNNREISGSFIYSDVNKFSLVNNNTSLTSSLIKMLGCLDENICRVSDAIKPSDKPFVIAIDDFDHLKNINNIKSFIVSLAEDSVFTKKYIILIILDDYNFASDILSWNGGSKFGLMSDYSIINYKWKDQHFRELLNRINSNLSNDIKEKLISSSIIAGTPYFLLKHHKLLSHNLTNIDLKFKHINDLAEQENKKWLDGINKLC